MKIIKPEKVSAHSVPNFVIRDGQLRLYGSEDEFQIEGFPEGEPVAVISYEHLKELRHMQLRAQALHEYHSMESEIHNKLSAKIRELNEQWKIE